MPRKVAERRKGCTVALTTEERETLQALADTKYHGVVGVSTVMREEAVKAARRYIRRLKAQKQEGEVAS